MRWEQGESRILEGRPAWLAGWEGLLLVGRVGEVGVRLHLRRDERGEGGKDAEARRDL